MGLLDGMFSGPSEEGSMVNLLFETKDIDKQSMTTRLPPGLVWDMSVMSIIGNRFRSKVLQDFRKQLYMHKVSEDGEGRLELSEAALAIRRSPQSED